MYMKKTKQKRDPIAACNLLSKLSKKNQIADGLNAHWFKRAQKVVLRRLRLKRWTFVGEGGGGGAALATCALYRYDKPGMSKQ